MKIILHAFLTILLLRRIDPISVEGLSSGSGFLTPEVNLFGNGQMDQGSEAGQYGMGRQLVLMIRAVRYC